jgi:mobilome CxxCx(11)CxxC protein
MTDMPGRSTREQCWDHAIHTFGTGFIFETRTKKLRISLRWLTFLGVAVPVAIGGIVLSFGTKSVALPYLLGAAGILAVAQLVLSVWSLVAAWNDNLAYAIESARSNYRLATRYEDLGRNSLLTSRRTSKYLRRSVKRVRTRISLAT